MPTSEAPTNLNEPKGPAEQPGDKSLSQGPRQNPLQEDPSLVARALGEEPQEPEQVSPVVRGSRWVDYDTHELLEMISELEDERRWARLREGALWAVLLHAAI
ncbi:MAG: hypothetical protein WBQ94_21940, partial [Terracidiphilus sp.]